MAVVIQRLVKLEEMGMPLKLVMVLKMVFVEEWERCAVEIFFVRQDWDEGLHSLSCQTPCLTL